MALLDQYLGPWTKVEAAHILRRVAFGFNGTQNATAVSDGLVKTVDNLIAVRPEPAAPVDPTNGQTFVTGTIDLQQANRYRNYIKAWWAELMVTQPPSITEKLTLFWMNHFATEMSVVGHPQMVYQLLSYLRKNALGNFKAMARQVTIEPAMLRYLNGSTNTKGNPNENYSRELQELFTIGKGPERSQGDYTNYTEQDVREAARVLTGWREVRNSTSVVFNIAQHDTGNKQFSSAYGNRVIQGRSSTSAGDAELDDLLNMIFDQQETRRYIVRRLYRWFVDSDITPQIEQEVIVPLGELLFASGWNVAPVLRKLLLSQHFYSASIRGAVLKSPADMVVGLLRSFQWNMPTDATQRYNSFFTLVQAMANAQMDIGEPPSVAGYEAFYQNPGYDRLWLNTATLPLRNGFTDSLVLGARDRGGIFDTIAFVRTLDNPSDPYAMVDGIVARFFSVGISESLRTTLVIDVLQQGGRDYDWTTQWDDYMADPNNTNNRTALKSKLDQFFRYVFRMAEFQLL